MSRPTRITPELQAAYNAYLIAGQQLTVALDRVLKADPSATDSLYAAADALDKGVRWQDLPPGVQAAYTVYRIGSEDAE